MAAECKLQLRGRRRNVAWERVQSDRLGRITTFASIALGRARHYSISLLTVTRRGSPTPPSPLHRKKARFVERTQGTSALSWAKLTSLRPVQGKRPCSTRQTSMRYSPSRLTPAIPFPAVPLNFRRWTNRIEPIAFRNVQKMGSPGIPGCSEPYPRSSSPLLRLLNSKSLRAPQESALKRQGWGGIGKGSHPSPSSTFVSFHPSGPRAYGLTWRAPMDESRRRQVEKKLLRKHCYAAQTIRAQE